MYTKKNQDIREGYNKGVREVYKNDYEFNRWFIRPRNRAEYCMTYFAIRQHVKDLKFKNCLEVGPGPGTWTRLVYRANPNAEFELVDISEAMREQFGLEMRTLPNVTYQVEDVMEYSESRKFELFFSSRAVEYFDNKSAFFIKLTRLMSHGSTGVIVTKNPYHGVRKSKKPGHQGQISMPKMKEYLESNGFKNVHFFPAVIRIPILSRFNSSVTEKILKKRVTTDLNIHKINRIVESYIVTFSLN